MLDLDDILNYIDKHIKVITITDVLIHYDLNKSEFFPPDSEEYKKVSEALRQNVFKQAKNYIEENPDVIFLDDIVSIMPFGKTRFYELFPAASEEAQTLKDMLIRNKINKKVELRRKWGESDNATLNVCLYKLLSSEHERKLLADKVESENTNTNFNFAADKDEYEQLCELINNWSK